ncbi:MAG: SulP family inorganic anion transporter [Chloroflexi bacterium]|nr:SulP family inorganic anion transporter [Chloroflexota bacterium]
MHIGLFLSLRGYRPEWLKGDIIAGLTVWAVLVPESLAYATIAGVSPVVGLYAAPGALLLYAIFGSSRHLVVGPMSATAALSASIVATVATPGSDPFTTATVALAVCVGIAGVVAALLRLGFLTNFISEPVLKGFIVGLALTIIIGQVPDLMGVAKVSGDFFEKLAGVIRELGSVHLPTLIVGLVSLAIVLGLKEVAPVLPGSLIAVGVGIAAVALLRLDEQGVEIVGAIAPGLPPLGLPALDLDTWMALAPAAVGVLLVGLAEGLGAAKAYAARDHYDVDANRELLGLGAANLASGLSAGMVVNGSLSKTAVNGAAGAKSQVSGLVVAGMVIVTLLFLTSLFEQLPEATLAGVVIAAVWELVDVRSLARLYRLASDPITRVTGIVGRPDFLTAIAAMLGVLVFDTLPGLFLGIVVSLVLLLYRAYAPHVATLGLVPGTTGQFGDVARHPENQVHPAVPVLRVDAALFFANAEHVRGVVRTTAAQPDVRAVVLDMGSVPSVDVSAVRMLAELRDDLAARDVRLVLARDLGQVRELMRRDLGDEGLADVYPDVRTALEALAPTAQETAAEGDASTMTPAGPTVPR